MNAGISFVASFGTASLIFRANAELERLFVIKSRYDSKETPSVTYGQLEMPFVAQPVLKIVLMKTTDNHCENREYVGQF